MPILQIKTQKQNNLSQSLLLSDKLGFQRMNELYIYIYKMNERDKYIMNEIYIYIIYMLEKERCERVACKMIMLL